MKIITNLDEGKPQPEGWVYFIRLGNQMKIGRTIGPIQSRIHSLNNTMYKGFTFEFAVRGANLEYEFHQLFKNFQCVCRHKSKNPVNPVNYLKRADFKKKYGCTTSYHYHYSIELFSIPYGSMRTVRKKLKSF